MSATQAVATAEARTQRHVAPRRSPRLSAGHLLLAVTALLAVLLNYSVLRGVDSRVPVAVAAHALQAGDVVSPAAFAFAEIRADDGLLALLLAPEQTREVDGWITVSALAAGDPIRRSDLRPPAAADGRRAMSLPIDPAHAVGGGLDTGDRVDVIAVTDGQSGYVATGLEVLAVSRQAHGVGLTGGGLIVTLAVDDAEALRLAAALRGEGLELVRATGAPPPSGGPPGGHDLQPEA